MTYLKKLVGMCHLKKRPTVAKISDGVFYHIDHISSLYLSKMMSPLVPPFLSPA